MSGSNTLELIEENLPDSLRNELEESDLGTQVGGSYGEQAGREIGQQVGSEIEQRFRSRLDAGATFGRALIDALKALPSVILHTLRESASPGSVISNIKSQLKNEATSFLSDKQAETSEAAEGAAETAADTAEEAADTAEEAAESIPGLPENVSKLREGTIRDLLGVMSYRDLQSTAKELGIKANQSQEEIINDVVAQVSGAEDESESAETESES